MPTNAFHDFSHMALDAAPAFAVALLLSAGVLVLTRRSDWLRSQIDRVSGSLPLATGIGALLPGCALGTLPLALVLRQHGAGIGTLTAFMITAAVLGPSSIILTALLLDLEMLLLRIVLPIGAVLVFGGLLNIILGEHTSPTPRTPSSVADRDSHPAAGIAAGWRAHTTHGLCCGGHHCKTVDPNEGEGVLNRRQESAPISYIATLSGMAKTLVPLLVLGLLGASMLRAWIPESFLHDWLKDGWIAYLVAAGAGVPAYVCEGGEVPLTLGLLNLGIGRCPAFTFMLASVGTCLPTLMVAPKIIGRPATAAYALFWIVFSIGAGWLVALIG